MFLNIFLPFSLLENLIPPRMACIGIKSEN